MKTTWLVLQRDISQSIDVRNEPINIATLVLDPTNGAALATAIASSRGVSLWQALIQAATEPADGRRPAVPAHLLGSPSLADEVHRQLPTLRDRLGMQPEVEIVEPALGAEDIFDSFIGFLAGRPQSLDPPGPEDWLLLHQEALRYAEQEPWIRWADDIGLQLELRVGASRTEMAASVLGNADMQYGLLLFPGRSIPAELVTLAEGHSPRMPPGTIGFTLDAVGVPPELIARARRYGWPSDRTRTPLFLAFTEEGPQELDRRHAHLLALGQAAVRAHDARGPVPASGTGAETTGQMIFPGGRRGRFRVRLAPPSSAPAPASPELLREVRMFSQRVRDDLLTPRTLVRLGRVPWQVLEPLRRRAAVHQPAPAAVSPAGTGLPVIVLQPEPGAGRRMARRLEAAQPVGVTMINHDGKLLVTLLCEKAAFGLIEVDSADKAVTRLRKQLETMGGAHAVLVADADDWESEVEGSVHTPRWKPGKVHGLFECRLRMAPVLSSE